MNRFYRPLDDDQFFDEIQIKVLPRFKTSGLSGDEWRVSAHVMLMRKGEVLVDERYGTLEAAVAFLPGLLIVASETPGEFRPKTNMCMQPSCANEATTEYRLKEIYHRGQKLADYDGGYYRRFCAKHAHRGDSDMEDCDANYELVTGELGARANIPEDRISEAGQVVIEVDRLEDLAAGVEVLRKHLGRKP